MTDPCGRGMNVQPIKKRYIWCVAGIVVILLVLVREISLGEEVAVVPVKFSSVGRTSTFLWDSGVQFNESRQERERFLLNMQVGSLTHAQSHGQAERPTPRVVGAQGVRVNW